MTPISRQTVLDAIEKFKSIRILVVGDIIIDHFIRGSVTRISPEAPVPVVNVTRENLLLGGAANVLNNIYALGGQGDLCGSIGTDIMGDQLLALLAGLPSPDTGIIRAADRPTTKKTRIIAQNQQVVRFDREKTGPLAEEDMKKIFHFLDNNISSYDAVVVSDYNKGLITAELMKFLQLKIRGSNNSVPLIVDPKPEHPERFKGATIITPNNHEAELMSGVRITDTASLVEASQKLLDGLECKAVLITRGEAGMALQEAGTPIFTIPTVAREVYDVTGAGDTVVATLALGLAAGLSCTDAATTANFAASIVVGKLGTATASTHELMEAIQ